MTAWFGLEEVCALGGLIYREGEEGVNTSAISKGLKVINYGSKIGNLASYILYLVGQNVKSIQQLFILDLCMGRAGPGSYLEVVMGHDLSNLFTIQQVGFYIFLF